MEIIAVTEMNRELYLSFSEYCLGKSRFGKIITIAVSCLCLAGASVFVILILVNGYDSLLLSSAIILVLLAIMLWLLRLLSYRIMPSIMYRKNSGQIEGKYLYIFNEDSFDLLLSRKEAPPLATTISYSSITAVHESEKIFCIYSGKDAASIIDKSGTDPETLRTLLIKKIGVDKFVSG